MMDAKLKHLELIQAVITRMAHNSFFLKGWSVTLTAAIFVLSTKGPNPCLILPALFPVLMFWGLDAYFLRQERLFRKLYDAVRLQEDEEIDFSMNTAPYQGGVASWMQVACSNTLLAFHLPIAVGVILVFLFLLSC